MGKRKKVVGFRSGIVINKETKDSYSTLQDAMEDEAKCGCGIDCCNNELILRDKSTGEKIAIYVEGGEIMFRLADGSTKTVTST